MVPVCPKVNYKCHYKPGWVLCPRTKVPVLFKDVEEMVCLFSQLPFEEKLQMPYIQLDQDFCDDQTEDEFMYEEIKEYVGQFPIVHNE